jgi:predicted nucleic acid-binding Zn ribbon protein
MEIAGRTCSICERKIVLSLDGKFCPHCGVIVHRACETQTKCHVCGQAFQENERPGIDPIWEAVLPRALRDKNTSIGVALICAVVGSLVVIFYYVFMELLSRGH